MLVTRRNWLGMAGVASAGVALTAAGATAPARIEVTGRGGRDPGPMLAALAAYAEAERTAFGLPGVTIGVALPGGIGATITLGDADLATAAPVTSGHLFQIGSISKSMVALCLFRLAALGRIDLDAPALAVAPDLPLPATGITIAQLLNHSSGLPDDAPLFTRANGDRLWTGFAGGTRFSYSNTGFDILGLIVARVAGTDYGRALQTLVLGPLALVDTVPLIRTRDRVRFAEAYVPFGVRAWFPGGRWAVAPWNDVGIPAGSVAATPGDMARYIAFLARLGRGDGAPLLPPPLAARFTAATIDAPVFGSGARYAAGLATIDVDGRRCLHHTGGMIAFRSAITVDPIAGGGVFASTNCGGSSYRPRAITRYGCRLVRAFAEGRSLPPPPAVTALPPIAGAAEFGGHFVAADGAVMRVTATNGGLTVDAHDPTFAMSARGATLQSVGTNEFVADDDGLAVHNLSFAAGPGPRAQLWWGGRHYGRDAAPAVMPEPARLAALAGLYLSDDPWVGGASIVVRGDRLVAEGSGDLVAAADGSWRFVDPAATTERVWFDAMLGGRAQRMSFSGNDIPRFHAEA